MKTTYMYLALVVLIIGGLVFVRNNTTAPTSDRTTKYDDFAQCLADNGARFFGAYWCPHCQEQKAKFDNSLKLPYIECSLPNGQGQNETCNKEGISGYPLWKFSDGSQLEGVQELATLADKTSCTLPAS